MKTLIFTFLLFYLFAILFLYLVQDKLIFGMQQYFPHSYNIIKDNSLNIIHMNHKQKDAIIYFPGNKERTINSTLLFKNQKNKSIYIMNYPGYAGHNGKPSEKEIFKDSLALYDLIKKDHEKIIVIGRSLGSGVAAYLSSMREIDELILITPYDSILNVAQDKYPFFPIKFILKHKFDSKSYIRKIEKIKPIIFISEHDKIVPHKNTFSLLETLKNKYTLFKIKKSNHNNIVYNNDFIKIFNKELN